MRNRLGYEKLRKLVYVRHNLKQRLKHAGAGKNLTKEKEADPCALLMDCTLFDESNPIMDWLNKPRIEYDLSLEEMLGRSKKRKILALQRGARRKGKRHVEHEEEEEEEEEEDFVETDNDTMKTFHMAALLMLSLVIAAHQKTQTMNQSLGMVITFVCIYFFSCLQKTKKLICFIISVGNTLATQQFEEQAEDNNGRARRARKKKRVDGYVY